MKKREKDIPKHQFQLFNNKKDILILKTTAKLRFSSKYNYPQPEDETKHYHNIINNTN